MLSKKRNMLIVVRFLLMAGYLFFFATQFSYRYYTIANFFVYGNYPSAAKAGRVPLAGGLHAAARSTAFRNTGQASHLAIDNRFVGGYGVRIADRLFLPVLSPIEVERRYGLLLQVYSSSDLPVNSLRGPPIA